jgi:hypothetical protein
MKERKASALSRLFYTFGTVLLMAVVAVCTVNYAKDGRAFQIPTLSAVTGAADAGTTSGAVKTSDEYKTIQYNKASTKSTSKTTSSKTGKSAGSKAGTAAAPSAKPAADP